MTERKAKTRATATATAKTNTGMILRYAQDDRYIVNKYKEATYYFDNLYTRPAQLLRVNNF